MGSPKLMTATKKEQRPSLIIRNAHASDAPAIARLSGKIYSE